MSKRIGLAAASLVAIVLGGASLAWACTPEAVLYVEPEYGPAGSTATVHGTRFSRGTVQIHWQSASGPQLATTTGPSFAVQVTIPDAAPGNYVVYAAAYDDAGEFNGAARAAFEVTGPDGQRARQPAEQEPAPARPQPRREAERDRAPSVERHASVARQASDSRATSTTGDRSVASEPRSPQTIATTDEGRRVFAGSLAPSSDRGARQASLSGARRFDAASRLSERTASGDIWSAVGSGSAPSLVPSLTSAPVADEGSRLGVVGLGLVGLGLVALAGLGLTTLRRTRSHAARRSGREAD